jgi:16S rRNA C1402 N4-methylase RsmH
MNKKLTLSLDSKAIDFAHSFSKKVDKPISKIIEDYFLEIKNTSNMDIPQEVEELYGIFADMGINVPDKKELRKMFHEDHIT